MLRTPPKVRWTQNAWPKYCHYLIHFILCREHIHKKPCYVHLNVLLSEGLMEGAVQNTRLLFLLCYTLPRWFACWQHQTEITGQWISFIKTKFSVFRFVGMTLNIFGRHSKWGDIRKQLVNRKGIGLPLFHGRQLSPPPSRLVPSLQYGLPSLSLRLTQFSPVGDGALVWSTRSTNLQYVLRHVRV